MSARDAIRASVIGALVGLALLVGCSSTAQAMPVDVAYARGVAYLTRQGIEVDVRPVVIGDAQVMLACGGNPVIRTRYGCGGLSYVDRIELAPSAWAEIVTWRRDDLSPGGGFYVLLHETLHRTGRRSGDMNEGATDALAADVYPGWIKAVTGFWAPPERPRYVKQVQVVREASARATGRPWRSWAARRWRRAYEQASDDVRVQMLAAAFTGQGAQ